MEDPNFNEISLEEWEGTKGLIDLDTIKKRIDESFINGKEKGEKTHFKPIDDAQMFTWKRGFLYCITGVPGSGKSELINQLAMIKSYHDKWKWKVYSPESYPIEDSVDTFMHSLMGKSTDPDFANQMSVKEKDIAFKWVKENFDFVDFDDMPTVDDLLSGARHYDGIIIDPFNSVDDGESNISKFLKNNLTKIKTASRKQNFAAVLIEHSVRS
jgi:twinkle protein